MKALLANEWIERCATGSWGSPLVLSPKPQQETIEDIDDLVWRMCVSYRGLNKVTKPFEYPIGRCDDAIDDVGNGTGCIIISMWTLQVGTIKYQCVKRIEKN